MKKYFFYFKNDPNKEPISSYFCDTQEEALEYFSKQKKLNKKTFLKIFIIITNDINSL